ncbi:Similar to carbon monoxide dehydrogenase CooS subunit, partial [hydrothermal vent metagenome]
MASDEKSRGENDREYQVEDELTSSRNAPEYKPGMPYKDRVKIVHKLNYTKEEVQKHTANKSIAEMIGVMDKKGITNTFDRFTQQHPQCGYGLTGACCAFCSYGPCRVDDKTSHSVCGKDVDLIVAGNALRRMAAGLAAHGSHAREVFLTLKQAALGNVPIAIKGGAKAIVVGKLLGIKIRGKTVPEVCVEIADRFIDDLQRAEPKKHDTLLALAPYERTKKWEEMGIIPISAYHECFESNNITSHGTDSDFDSHMEAFLRTALVYAWSTVIATSIATDILYGIPKRSKINVNLGVIRKDNCVNIALNGHTPTVAFAICDLVKTDRIKEKVKAVGADDIMLYGMCCTGGEFAERDLNVPMVSMASSSEMAVATGAFEAVVIDMQDVLPGISKVAKHFHTKLITTSASCRKEGAERVEIDYYFSNLDDIYGIAERI